MSAFGNVINFPKSPKTCQREALADRIKPGASFNVEGRGPTFDDFVKVAAGRPGKLSNVHHKFHFIVSDEDEDETDEVEVLVMWFCDHVLYQRRMNLSDAVSLLKNLEGAGFSLDQLN